MKYFGINNGPFKIKNIKYEFHFLRFHNFIRFFRNHGCDNFISDAI